MQKQQSSSYDVIEVTDTRIVIVDRDQGRSVTNDAENVVRQLGNSINGGIGLRKIYYRDTAGRFDELETKDGRFIGFKACSVGQQHQLGAVVHSALKTT